MSCQGNKNLGDYCDKNEECSSGVCSDNLCAAGSIFFKKQSFITSIIIIICIVAAILGLYYCVKKVYDCYEGVSHNEALP